MSQIQLDMEQLAKDIKECGDELHKDYLALLDNKDQDLGSRLTAIKDQLGVLLSRITTLVNEVESKAA